MKITHVTTRAVITPADTPLVFNRPTSGTLDFVTLELGTDEGLVGVGVPSSGPR